MTDELARSQERWRGDEPDTHLTWGVAMAGDPFVDFLVAHALPGNSATIVEIGPGYGRITAPLIERVPFGRYIGLEISRARVKRLIERFPDPRIEFREADILGEAELGTGADLTLGSAVFEHFYPDFARALERIGRFTKPGGRVLIDLVRPDDALTTSGAEWFGDTAAYVRVYSIAELIRLFDASPFALDALGHISFGPSARDEEIGRTILRGTKRGG